MGLEPMTSPLPRECSTTELQEPNYTQLKLWCRTRDLFLNRGNFQHFRQNDKKPPGYSEEWPSDCQNLEREKGLEPSALSLEG